MARRMIVVLALVAGAGALAACSSARPTALPRTGSVPRTGTGTGAPVPRTDAAGVVWLCRPGLANDPCTRDLSSTTLDGSANQPVTHATSASNAPFDCFYAYPTVSQEPGPNADLTVQPIEELAAVEQASRFSTVCNVWAPMYRQRTSADLGKGLAADPAADLTAYASLLAGWQDYLAHFNDGRPVIFLGHSQGAILLVHLLATLFDPNPALRQKLVSAVLLGANVQVATGSQTGGSFSNIPACTAGGQVGCVIAYSSFEGQPPADSLFGIPGQGVSAPQHLGAAGQQVVCTNPAALASAPGGPPVPLDAYGPALLFPSSGASTPWVEDLDEYAGACRQLGDASWLQISDIAPAGDTRPVIQASLGPQWGLHLYDVNLALGDLVKDVAAQEAAYRTTR